MEKDHAINAEQALKESKHNSAVLLADVRDEPKIQAIGMGIGAVNAPGRSLA